MNAIRKKNGNRTENLEQENSENMQTELEDVATLEHREGAWPWICGLECSNRFSSLPITEVDSEEPPSCKLSTGDGQLACQELLQPVHK